MSTREKTTLLIYEELEHGVDIEVDADSDTVYFAQFPTIGGWFFQIAKQDWEILKKYVDGRMSE